MYLDEKLLRTEADRERRERQEKHLKELKEDFVRQEQEQKSVDDWVRELGQGAVVIDGREYLCEKKMILGKRVPAFILSDDVAGIVEENNIATIYYRSLEIGTNITFLDQPAVIKNETEFQEKLTEQYLKDKITYHSMETGKFQLAAGKVYYAEGILTSAAGGVFINNFYCSSRKGTVAGNYTCILLRRYFYEHLFRAMIRLMFEED